jgi:DNA (cytosine-5)-methyltransferase 1
VKIYRIFHRSIVTLKRCFGDSHLRFLDEPCIALALSGVVGGRREFLKMLTYGCVCSGIGAATVAWEPLGWKPAWFSEILPFPSAVLAHHYPETPNLGDVTQIYDEATFLNKRIEILVGGTPCQSFSVAGLRKALEDPRGNLMLEFLRLAHIKRPRWLVWENVPGVLSSNCEQ